MKDVLEDDGSAAAAGAARPSDRLRGRSKLHVHSFVVRLRECRFLSVIVECFEVDEHQAMGI